MKIKFKNSVAIGGKHHGAGSVADLDDQTAIAMVNQGCAILVNEETKTENRAVGVKGSDETKAPAKRGRKKKEA